MTLIGPGGVGKTRLALEMASSVWTAYPDGVWLANLASLEDHTTVEWLAQAVATTLGVADQSDTPVIEALASHLQNRRLLLVLDNCEHLTDKVCVVLAAVLPSAPGVQVLATSRWRLIMPGEMAVEVPPLSHTEAVTLLLDRARAALPEWKLTDANTDAVNKLLERVDRIPLAIELAAAWLTTLTVEEIVDRFSHGSDLVLSGGAASSPRHHRALRQTFDRSWALASPCERLLWARLSVFRGGFDLAAAEIVGADPDHEDREVTDEDHGSARLARDRVAAVLRRLVDQSIVSAQSDPVEDGKTRFRMLPTLREYAQERLREFGDDGNVSSAHWDYYRALVASARRHWFGPDQNLWMGRLKLEWPNVLKAVEHGLAHGHADLVVEMATNLARTGYFQFHGLLPQGRAMLERVLALAQPSPRIRVAAQIRLAWIVLTQGDPGPLTTLLNKRDQLREETGGDLVIRALLAKTRGLYDYMVRGSPEGIDAFAEARDRFREAGPDYAGDEQRAKLFVAFNAGFFGTEDQALDAARQCLAGAEAREARWEMAFGYWTLAVAWRRRGDYPRAVDALRTCLSMERDLDERFTVSWSTLLMAALAADTGHYEHGARLLGATSRLQGPREVHGEVRGVANLAGMRGFAVLRAEAEEVTRKALSPQDYRCFFAEGAALDGKDEVLQVALDERSAPLPPSESTPTRPAAATLSPRECEVAELVAQGLSNRDIAERLTIALRTATTHVDHIMRKLGVNSRAQIAAWVVEQRQSGQPLR